MEEAKSERGTAGANDEMKMDAFGLLLLLLLQWAMVGCCRRRLRLGVAHGGDDSLRRR